MVGAMFSVTVDAWQVGLHRTHPGSFSLESLIPVFFVLGLPVLAGAPFLPSPLGWIAAAPYALYVVLAVLFGFGAGVRRGIALVPMIALAFPVIHVALGTGYLTGRLRRFPRGPDSASTHAKAAPA